MSSKKNNKLPNTRRRYYMVGTISRRQKVSISGPGAGVGLAEINMTWAKGMVGVIPVFDSQEAADEYANGSSQVFTFVAEQSKV